MIIITTITENASPTSPIKIDGDTMSSWIVNPLIITHSFSNKHVSRKEKYERKRTISKSPNPKNVNDTVKKKEINEIKNM